MMHGQSKYLCELDKETTKPKKDKKNKILLISKKHLYL